MIVQNTKFNKCFNLRKMFATAGHICCANQIEQTECLAGKQSSFEIHCRLKNRDVNDLKIKQVLTNSIYAMPKMSHLRVFKELVL